MNLISANKLLLVIIVIVINIVLSNKFVNSKITPFNYNYDSIENEVYSPTELSHLSSNICNKNQRAKIICYILSKSKKFNNINNPHIFNQIQYSNRKQELLKRMDIYEYPMLVEDFKSTNTFSQNKRQGRIPFRQRFKGRHLQFKQKLRQKFHYFRNLLTDHQLPLTITGAPLVWTLGTLLLLKSKLNKPKRRILMGMGHSKPMMPIMHPTEELESDESDDSKEDSKEKKKMEKAIKSKFALTKEILGLTSESLGLANSKLDLFNIVSKSLLPILGGGGGGGEFQKLNHQNKLNGTDSSEDNRPIKEQSDIQLQHNLNISQLVENIVRTVSEKAVKNISNKSQYY